MLPFAISWTINSPTRLMSQSMRLKREPSKSFLQMKRIQLQLGKIWCVWSLEALHQEVRRRRQTRNPKSLLQRINLHLQILSLRSKKSQNQRMKRQLRLRRRRRSQSPKGSLRLQSNLSPKRRTRNQAVLPLHLEAEKSVV